MSELISQLWFVGGLSLVYVASLFVIAMLGGQSIRQSWQPYVYSLTLAIFCTTWAFYGTVQQAMTHGWLMAPTYAGAIVLMTVGWKIMDRMIRVARQENSTTISDFISARYGHSRGIGALVALLCLLGVVPYIALQLKAVSDSFQLVTSTSLSKLNWYSDPTLIIAAIMALFSILFGTRAVDSSESHQGLMLAIAFESLIKLVALMAVGIFVVYGLFDGFIDLFDQAMAEGDIAQTLTEYSNPSAYLTHMLLGAIAIMALPRHFHATVVEYRSERDLKTARWLYPLYLFGMNLFLLPIGLAAMLDEDLLSSFTYITLELPLAHGETGLALLAYIGGLSAGTSMVIISSITLATMICNELVIPLLLKSGWQGDDQQLKRQVLLTRRIAIIAVLMLSFCYYRLLSHYHSLSEIGLLALVAIAQFAPAMLLGMIWQGANRLGAYLGILAGFLVWFYTLFVPVLVDMDLLPLALMDGAFGLEFLSPYGLLGLNGLDPIVHGTFWSLFINSLLLVIGSLYHHNSYTDIEQANRFVLTSPQLPLINAKSGSIRTQDLKSLLGRFLSPAKMATFFEGFSNPLTGRLVQQGVASDAVIREADRLLSSVVGRKGAQSLLRNLSSGRSDHYDNLRHMVDEVSDVVSFNRDLLNSILHSLNQGINVLDDELNLVAWNQRFAEIYGFQNGELYVGQPAESLLRHILLFGQPLTAATEEQINQRILELKAREPLRYVRKTPDGRFIELNGRPIGSDLYITVFSDITQHKQAEDQLRQANEELEQRVSERTRELTELNEDLEIASRNKTRFLAAAGHDLVQPLNSASLFSAALLNKLQRVSLHHPDLTTELTDTAQLLDHSLHSAESLLNELLEISKLDAELIKPKLRDFPVTEVLSSLATEFQPIAAQKKLLLHYVPSSCGVHSDPVLLRRILQNLLSNALRYTRHGRVLIGVRRLGQQLRIDVLDTGCGIPADQQELVFEEFHRLDPSQQPLSEHDSQTPKVALGLGLAIVKRLGRLLDHPLELSSTVQRGTRFSVLVPMATAPLQQQQETQTGQVATQSGLLVCIDNDPLIVSGMSILLQEWGYQVVGADSLVNALPLLDGRTPDALIVDYHLNAGATGLDALAQAEQQWPQKIPGLMITADYTEELKQNVEEHGYQLMHKPVKPMALRAWLRACCH
ncbi:hybrid sensor histidine kinase/response regulator [Oceanobacter mangrovi]|uniref:hybrid sensor histidine kinase/response regulator n=1 Tax=Oceanobacter mangrovi TaxID=2862510 RepID=UPI001C8D7C22|nr:PAS-domain containing protein [Oceanobacter mangrovi]